MDIVHLSMTLIDEDKDQPRYQFNEEALQELMKSIDEIGLLSPIKVRHAPNGRYMIIYGNRRYKATQMLGRDTIPCIVSDATDEMEIYLEQIAENLTREGFSPIEEAEAFDKLLNDSGFRSSMKFLSAKLGKPESYIKNKCELLKFSGAVKKLIVGGTEIRKDKLTEDQLLPLKDLPMEHREPLALIAARDELPVSDVKKIAKMFKDKTITEKTKEKLLLKTGSGLIDTWSVYEQNRKEKKKREQEEKEYAEEQVSSASVSQPAGISSQTTKGSSPMMDGGGSAADMQSGSLANTATATATISGFEAMTALLKEQKGALSEQGARLARMTDAISELSYEENASALKQVEQIIQQLDKQLTEWYDLKQRLHSR